MEITWLGHANFRLRGREGVVVTDPALWKGAAGRTTADLVTVSHPHPGHNQAALVGGEPRVISGPGEYEVKGIVVTGVATYHDAEKGKKRGKNTAYVIGFDDLLVCHLGDLGHLLSTDQVDQMRNVDVLLIPVGGGVTVDAAQAVEVISLVEPRVVIPMHFRVGDLDPSLDPVDRFLREMGVADSPPQPKATFSRSNLPDGTQVVVLEPRAV